jgi:hypothetical protein
MAGEEAAKKSGAGGVLAWLLVVVLLGAVFWLASERNARHWALAVDNNQLVVQRGRFFPTGAKTIDARDAELGKAYGPIVVPPGAKAIEGEFEDRTALDRALFDQLLPWAKALAEKADADSQAGSMALAERASHLPGLSQAQLDQLSSLRGDLAYTAALGELQLAAGMVESARRRLHQAAQHGGKHAVVSAQLGAELKGIADRLGTASVGILRPAPAPAALERAPEQGDGGTADGGR